MRLIAATVLSILLRCTYVCSRSVQPCRAAACAASTDGLVLSSNRGGGSSRRELRRSRQMADDDFHHTPPPSGGGDDDRDGGSTPSYRGGGGGGGDDDASSSRGRDDVRRPRFFYDAAVDVGDGAVVRSDVIDVILLTDRIAVLSAVLASVCVNTNAALRFHLVVPDSGLAEARVKLMPSQCAGADWRLLAESAVVQSIRDSGLTVTWEVEVPSTNLSVRAPAWDRSPKHNTVFNCLRFYLPRLPEFAELESIIFMDDDVIMQGDIARLWELPLSEPLSAGCINWIWNSCGRMEASSNLSYVEVPYMGFGALPRGGDGSVVDLTCADADERGCAPSGLFASLSNASAEIQGTRLDLDALRAKRAWNFGLNKFNLTAWRVANITERYIAWIAANREFGWFPTTSLAYGLGIPYLTLADDVACMDDVGMPVLHGLGFVEPDDLKLSDIPLESISSFYALHWNGDRKPYAWRGAIPEYKEHFLAYAPAIKKTETDEAQRELASIGSKSRSFVVWTAPHSGSEWFMSVLDEHENVCASGGGAGGTGRGWPRDSLLPIHDLSEEDDMRVCQPKTLCHWAKVSRLLATLLDDDDGSGVPSVCDATFDARVMKYDDFYGIHLETLCAILERAAAAVEGNTVDLGRGGGGTRSESWITRVMQESFRVFVAENLRPPTLALSSQNATDKIGRALARGGNSLQMPCACPSSTTISGTKVMNDWLNNEAVSDGISRAKKIYNFYNLAGVLEELGSKIIVLDRENLLETYVSLRVAEPTSPHEGRLSIDVNRLLRFVRQQLRQREERDDRLAEKRFKVLHVQYESCIANKRACFQEVLGFLEVESNARVLDELGAASFDSTSRDTRTVVSLEQRILNFNAVAEALVVNGFERYLTNEDLNLVSNYTPTFGGGAAAKNSSRLASIEDDVHVLIMSDRAPALAATLSSTCATTSSIANLVIHLVLPNHSEDPTWRIEDVVDECWGARFEIRSIASIEDELLNRHGVRPVWTSWSNAEWHQVVAPKYARDRSSKHMSPFNLARFYVPLLREYEGVRRLLLLDDDVIVQRDIAFAHDVSFGEDAVVLAGCQNWISSPHEGFFRMTPNHLLRVFETPHFGFRRIRPGGALSDALCDDDAHYDCMPSTFLASLSDAWRDVRCQVPTECPEDDEAIVRGLAAQPAWNFGLVSVDVHAWRRKNLTRVYHAWTNVAEMRGLFPAGSLAHGLGLAYLALEDEVECWESLDAYERHVRIGVLQGLGYIMPQDLAAANLSTHEAYALHFNGEVKPWEAWSPYSKIWDQHAPLTTGRRDEGTVVRRRLQDPYTTFAPTPKPVTPAPITASAPAPTPALIPAPTLGSTPASLTGTLTPAALTAEPVSTPTGSPAPVISPMPVAVPTTATPGPMLVPTSASTPGLTTPTLPLAGTTLTPALAPVPLPGPTTAATAPPLVTAPTPALTSTPLPGPTTSATTPLAGTTPTPALTSAPLPGTTASPITPPVTEPTTLSPIPAPITEPTVSPIVPPVPVPTVSLIAAPEPTESPITPPEPTVSSTAVPGPTVSSITPPVTDPTVSPIPAPIAVPTTAADLTVPPVPALFTEPTASPIVPPVQVPTASLIAAPEPTESPITPPEPTVSSTAVPGPTVSSITPPVTDPTVSPIPAPIAVPTAATITPTAADLTVTPVPAPILSPTLSPITLPVPVPTASLITAPGPTVFPLTPPASEPTVSLTSAPEPTVSLTAAPGPTASPITPPATGPTVSPTSVSDETASPITTPIAGSTLSPSVSSISGLTTSPIVPPATEPTVSPILAPIAGSTVSPITQPASEPTVSSIVPSPLVVTTISPVAPLASEPPTSPITPTLSGPTTSAPGPTSFTIAPGVVPTELEIQGPSPFPVLQPAQSLTPSAMIESSLPTVLLEPTAPLSAGAPTTPTTISETPVPLPLSSPTAPSAPLEPTILGPTLSPASLAPTVFDAAITSLPASSPTTPSTPSEPTVPGPTLGPASLVPTVLDGLTTSLPASTPTAPSVTSVPTLLGPTFGPASPVPTLFGGSTTSSEPTIPEPTLTSPFPTSTNEPTIPSFLSPSTTPLPSIPSPASATTATPAFFPSGGPAPVPTVAPSTSLVPAAVNPSPTSSQFVTIGGTIELGGISEADTASNEDVITAAIADSAGIDVSTVSFTIVDGSRRRRRLEDGELVVVDYTVTPSETYAEDVLVALSSTSPETFDSALGTWATALGSSFDFSIVSTMEISDPVLLSSIEPSLSPVSTSTPMAPSPVPTSEPTSSPTSIPTLRPCDEIDELLPSPPFLTAAAFTSSGARTLVDFDSPTDQAGWSASTIFPCSELLSFDDADEAECFWVNSTQIDAEVSNALQFVPGSSITLVGNTTKAACVQGTRCDCYPFANESTVDAGASSPVIPMVVFQGPAETSVCDDLFVSAEQSTGSGGRDLVFEWEIRAKINTTNASSLGGDSTYDVVVSIAEQARGKSFLQANSNQLESLLLNGSVSQLELILNTSNFLGERASDRHNVKLDPDFLPYLEIIGGERFTLTRSEELEVIAEAYGTDCENREASDRQIEMQWTLYDASDWTIIYDYPSVSNNALNYRLDPYTLASNTSYRLQAKAIDHINSFNLVNVASAIIKVGLGDVVALISGGNSRSASVDETVLVSASESSDSDVQSGEDAGLSFAWNCLSIETGGTDCGFYNSIGDPQLVIKPGNLSAGLYVFQVVVTASDGVRSDYTSATLRLVQATPPSVEILSSDTAVDSDAKLTIQTEVAMAANSDEPTTVTSSWSLTYGELAQSRSLDEVARTSLSITRQLSRASSSSMRYAHDLVIGEDSLVAGGSYTFQLEASTESATGFANIELTVRIPPSSGVLEVSPTSGAAFFDLFELRALRWVGDEPPLRYRFETENNVVLRTATLDNILRDARLPVPTTPPWLDVTVVVTDAVGASSSDTEQINIQNTSSYDLLQLTLDALESAFANYSLNTVCQIVTASASVAGIDASLLDLLVLNLTDSFAQFGDNDQDIAEQLIAALLAPTTNPNILFYDTAYDALDLTKLSLDILVRTGLGTSSSTAPGVAGSVLSNLLESNLFANATANSTVGRSRRNDTDASSVFLEAVDAITLAQRNTLVENEDVDEFRSRNLYSASRNFSSALGTQTQTVGSAFMNASANITAAEGVVYGVSVTEFEINPHNSDEAVSQVVRFHLSTSDGTSEASNATGLVLRIPGSQSLVGPASAASGSVANDAIINVSNSSSNVTAECECGFFGVKLVRCPDGALHELRCNGTQGLHTFTCSTSRHVCSTWDPSGSMWIVPDYCNAVEREGYTTCSCSMPTANINGGEDYSTIAETRDTIELYTRTFRTTPKIKDSQLVLTALAVLLTLVLCAHFTGVWLDSRERVKTGGTNRSLLNRTPTRMDLAGGSPATQEEYFSGQSRSVFSTRTSARILRIMTRRHPIVNFFREYNPEVSRSVRAWKLGLEVIIFFAALGLEALFEYPNIDCNAKQTRRDCRRPRSISHHRLCSWDDCGSPACFDNEPGSAAANSTTHFIILMLVLALMLPFLSLIDWLFEHYLMAPCPPSLRRLCCRAPLASANAHDSFEQASSNAERESRRRRAEMDGDEVYRAGALDGDEVYRAGALDGDEVYRAGALAGDEGYRAAAFGDDYYSRSRGRGEDPIIAKALRQESNVSSCANDDVALVFPASEAGSRVRDDYRDDEDDFVQVPPEEVDIVSDGSLMKAAKASSSRLGHGALESKDIVRLNQAWMAHASAYKARIQSTRFSGSTFMSAAEFPSLIDLCVDTLRVEEEEASAETAPWSWSQSISGICGALAVGARALGSTRRLVLRHAARHQHFALCASKLPRSTRNERRMQMRALVKKVRQAIVLRQTELHACMSEARRLPDPRVADRAINVLKRLEMKMLSDWGWVPSQRLWEVNIHARIQAHMHEAFLLKEELDETRGIRAEDTRRLRREKLVEAEKRSMLSRTERTIYQRTMTRALWQKSLPQTPPLVATYIVAWVFIILLVAAIVVLCMQLATSIGKGKSKLWLIGVVMTIFLFYCVILPLEILMFDYVIPSLLLERLKQVEDPTKRRRFPYKTKLPESPTFFVILMSPHDYANTHIGAYALQDDIASSVHYCARSCIVRVPDALHELVFEEVLIAAVIFSKIMGNLPSWFGNSEGDRGEVLAMALVVVFFLVLGLVVALLVALCNCLERMFFIRHRGSTRLDEAPPAEARPHSGEHY